MLLMKLRKSSQKLLSQNQQHQLLLKRMPLSQQKLTRKVLKVPQLLRLPSQPLPVRKKPRKKKKKSQWTKPPLRLTHPLLPMLLKTQSHKPQFNITKLSQMKMKRFRPNMTHTTQTQWDP
jgi:hypothetical protein